MISKDPPSSGQSTYKTEAKDVRKVHVGDSSRDDSDGYSDPDERDDDVVDLVVLLEKRKQGTLASVVPSHDEHDHEDRKAGLSAPLGTWNKTRSLHHKIQLVLSRQRPVLLEPPQDPSGTSSSFRHIDGTLLTSLFSRSAHLWNLLFFVSVIL